MEKIFNDSALLQYLNLKSGAIHGNSKSRRSLANWYAIYAILNFYVNDDFVNNRKNILILMAFLTVNFLIFSGCNMEEVQKLISKYHLPNWCKTVEDVDRFYQHASDKWFKKTAVEIDFPPTMMMNVKI